MTRLFHFSLQLASVRVIHPLLSLPFVIRFPSILARYAFLHTFSVCLSAYLFLSLERHLPLCRNIRAVVPQVRIKCPPDSIRRSFNDTRYSYFRFSFPFSSPCAYNHAVSSPIYPLILWIYRFHTLFIFRPLLRILTISLPVYLFHSFAFVEYARYHHARDDSKFSMQQERVHTCVASRRKHA